MVGTIRNISHKANETHICDDRPLPSNLILRTFVDWETNF